MKEVHENTAIIINGERISYSIIYSKRKTTCIMIHPDQSVIIRAPLKANRSDLEQWIHGRIPWIHKHLQYFKKKEAIRPKNNFCAGELHFYLGNKLPLHITVSKKNSVSFLKDEILIHSKNSEAASIEKILGNALKEKANELFSERLKFCHMKTEKYKLPLPDMRLRWMKSRWGSCSISRGITLNIRLIHLPLKLIDHVILHELCHLRVRNHGRDFYRMLSEFEPDWKMNKSMINQMAHLVLPRL